MMNTTIINGETFIKMLESEEYNVDDGDDDNSSYIDVASGIESSVGSSSVASSSYYDDNRNPPKNKNNNNNNNNNKKDNDYGDESCNSSNDDDDEDDEDDDDLDDNNKDGNHPNNQNHNDPSRNSTMCDYNLVRKKYANKESKCVQIGRILVILSMIIIGTIISTTVYMKLVQEQEELEQQQQQPHQQQQQNQQQQQQQQQESIINTDTFVLYSNVIEQNYHSKIRQLYESNHALSSFITLSSSSSSSDTTTNDNYENNYDESSLGTSSSSSSLVVSEFPYLWVHNFETYAYEARISSNVNVIIYAPIVSNITQWIEFTYYTKGWYEESKYQLLSLLQNTEEEEEEEEKAEEEVGRTASYYVNDISNVYKFIRSNNNDTTTLEPYNINDTTDGQLFCPRLYTSPPPPLLLLNNNDTITNDYYNTIQNEDLYTNIDYNVVSLASNQLHDLSFSKLLSSIYANNINVNDDNDNDYYTLTAQPVYDSNINDYNNNQQEEEQKMIVGYIFSIFSWKKYLIGLIPSSVTINNEIDSSIYAIVRNTCNQSVTYQLIGGSEEEIQFIGHGDLHDPLYDAQKRTIYYSNNPNHNMTNTHEEKEDAVDGHCQYYIDLYPATSSSFDEVKEEKEQQEEESFDNHSKLPMIFLIVSGFGFMTMLMTFFLYDCVVASRDDKVVGAAARSGAIVASLFPSNVRDRLLAEQESKPFVTNKKKKNIKPNDKRHDKNKKSLKGFLEGEAQDTEMIDSDLYKTKPIADLFPETTIMFGDIVGFTAWSSVREPAQIFTLLETLYHAFDEIANRRRVFKVETVGDCYVAVCGLPDPKKDHAITMARFARDCMYKMWGLTNKLEVTLGPDTGDLTMRIGLHSGPVTAGVLRGEKSRFQLFGDTMNTASRMETNGAKDRIHLSQETASLIMEAGKSNWIIAREDKIVAKGKGELQTYWLTLTEKYETGKSKNELGKSEHVAANEDNAPEDQDDDAVQSPITLDSKQVRLIEWQVEVLHRLLKQIVAKRISQGRQAGGTTDLRYETPEGMTVLDEVKEIITLPQSKASLGDANEPNAIELPPNILHQLTSYVTKIASMYHDNHFHNFEHASHVTMSVVKLLSRIVAPSDLDVGGDAEADTFSLHDHTYGITSDPLTQFACVFSALIHDLDHSGVPNAQLVSEKSELATYYKNKSVAEQNSVDLAWQVLMSNEFSDLRCTIYGDDIEMKRFRQLVVNSVMATDIVDKELKELRNGRWEKAFSLTRSEENVHDTVNRKATIVIEHLIQASDVSHTMQHWHIYRKWNARFFAECYQAFKEGRAAADPSINWYKGEIGFFDFYIIPLAKKLKDCGVFGVSSDEYLNYAMKNREEWERRGQEVVDEMIERVNEMYNNNNNDKNNNDSSITLPGAPSSSEEASATTISPPTHMRQTRRMSING